MKPVQFHPAALEEFRSSARYYENQQEGLGSRFIDAVESALARIQSNPLIFRQLEKGIRKCRVIRFPYGIIFRERSEQFEVMAVMHLHRNPDYWRSRI